MPLSRSSIHLSSTLVIFATLSACRAPNLSAPVARATNDTVTPPTPSTPELAAAVPLAPQSCAPPKDLGVRMLGRFDGCNPNGPRSSWSGSGFVARFTGTGLRMSVSGPAVRFTALVDGHTRSEFVTAPGKGKYVVASGLDPGEHTVSVSRQGEASFGAIVLEGVEPITGELLAPPPAPALRIEVVGDSISAGYGNEGTSPSCPFSADTENHDLTYGAILARSLGAELSTVAWSGKGIVSNYGGNREQPMPTLYDRAEPNDVRSVWNYDAWQADLVIVNLGTNDYSTNNDPEDDEFTRAYERLLTTIRLRYPGARILCTLGPLLAGSDLTKAETNIRAAVARRTLAGDQLVQFHAMRVTNSNPGCDWHPGLATHAAMAKDLEAKARAALALSTAN